MRELLFIPTIHDDKDMGSLREGALSQLSGVKLAPREWVWSRILSGLDRLNFDPRGKKLFAEGVRDNLPAVTEQIPFKTALVLGRVEVMLGHFGRDHMLKRAMYSGGSEVIAMETSSHADKRQKELAGRLGADLNALQKAKELTEKPNPGLGDLSQAAMIILASTIRGLSFRQMILRNQHDNHYAGIINDNLGSDEQGVLVVGAGHNVLKRLPKDINVQFVDQELEEVWRYMHSGLFAKQSSDKSVVNKMREFSSFGELQG